MCVNGTCDSLKSIKLIQMKPTGEKLGLPSEADIYIYIIISIFIYFSASVTLNVRRNG